MKHDSAALQRIGGSSFFSAHEPRSAADRWATLVLKACTSNDDPKTLGEWAKVAGVSRSSLCESCRLLNISPHDARDLARILRAVLNCPIRYRVLVSALDVRDRRTLKKLFERAGLTHATSRCSVSIEQLFKYQLFVSQDNDGLLALRDFFDRPLASITKTRAITRGVVP